MTENRFGQLPVVDSAGELIGMISQQSLLSLYFFTGGAAPLLDLPIHHALEPAAVLTEGDDLFTAVDLLTAPGTGAAVVVRRSEEPSAAKTPGQPVGIMTGKDMTHFFRALFEGIILIERMEIALRDYTSRAFPDEESLNAAAMAVFGPGPNKPHLPARNPFRLTLGDRILLMVHDANWPRFEPVLGPRSVFMPLAQLVRQARNELMHFRGQLGTLEHDGLVRAYTWLMQRPPWPDDAAPATPATPATPAAAPAAGALPLGEQAETGESAESS
jgi:CBS domain-containing protein